MSNAIRSLFAKFGAKKAAADQTSGVKDGFATLTAGKTDEQKAQQNRAKDRNAAYEQKKKDREERKKKLTNQWADNKK